MPRLALICCMLAAIPAAFAWAAVPSTVPAAMCPENPEAPDYVVAARVQRTAPAWQAFVAIGWHADNDCMLVELSQQGSALHRLTPQGVNLLGRSPEVAVSERAPSAEVQVRRHGADLIVSADRRLLLRVLIEEPIEGGAGAWAGDGASVSDTAVQPLGEISFDEDFFEREQVPSRWETLAGSWQVGLYWDPLQRRANYAPGACWYQPGEGECLTATGYWFWDSYTAEATVRLDSGAGGIACHIEGDDCVAFVISASDGAARIVRRGNPVQTLAETRLAVEAGQWYRLSARVLPGKVIGSVNGREVVAADLPAALTGQVGLLALNAPNSRFDDVRVRGLRGVAEPAEDDPATRWAFSDGTWRIEKGALRARVAGAQVAALRAGEWTDCVVSARVSPTRNCTAGLATHHEFGDRAYLFTITAGSQPTWHLHAVSGGKTEKLAEGPAATPDGLMTLSWVGGRLDCYLDGRRLCHTWDFRAAPGRCGVYVGGGGASFADFSCIEPEREAERAICDADGTGTRVPALEEKQMVAKIGGLWRGLLGRWSSGNTDVGPTITGNPSQGQAKLRFHQVTPGDARLVAELLTPIESSAFGLGLCVSDGPGYELALQPAEGTARLMWRGQEVARAEGIELRSGSDTVELLRDGRWVVARLGRWQGLAFRDGEPLPSGYAEVLASGDALHMSRLTLTGDTAHIYAFDRPEPDWRPASGTWTEHTGMACILWDYWMSGDGRQEPALTWNRHPVAGDVTVDVQVSEYTEGYEEGEHQHFPYHDAKVVLCGSPDEPGSGYSFIVGADGGRRTVLLRNGVEVASNNDPRLRITMGGHCNTPRAVELRAWRHGARLALTVTGAPALQWDDPEPLPGGYVGLGAEKCRANFRDCIIYPDLTWTGGS